MATAAPSAPALSVDPSVRLRARHTRTQVLGLSLQAAMVAIFAGIVAFAEPAMLAEFAPILAILLAGAFLVWRFGTWSKVVGILLGAAHGAMMSGFVIHHIGFVQSVADFVPGVLLIVGVSLTVGGGVAAIVRRGAREAAATTLERRIRVGALAVVGAAIVLSGTLHLVNRGSVSAAEAAGAVPATMSDFEFAEGAYTVDAGGSVVVHNTDPFAHDFTVPALGISEVIVPGSQELIAIDAEPGTYQVICTPHAGLNDDGVYEGMVAQLTVR